MNNELDEILSKLKSVVNDEQRTLFVCDKENSKILLNYIEKLNLINDELYNLVWNYAPNKVCLIILDKLKNLKKYEEIFYDEK